MFLQELNRKQFIILTDRSANRVAHELARVTCSMSDTGEWYITPPDFITHVLAIDNLN